MIAGKELCKYSLHNIEKNNRRNTLRIAKSG